MKRYEKDEIQSLPPKYRPLTSWKYFWLNILYSIPLIGTICLIVFAISDSNINRRSHARSYFCAVLIVLILAAVIFIIVAVAGGGLPAFIEQIQQMISEMMPQ